MHLFTKRSMNKKRLLILNSVKFYIMYIISMSKYHTVILGFEHYNASKKVCQVSLLVKIYLRGDSGRIKLEGFIHQFTELEKAN
jgi:hypothetical protein